MGVYLGLSALDFPFCFLAVRMVGPDRIGEVEHAVVDWFWHCVAAIAPSMRPQDREVVEDVGAAEKDIAADARKHKEDASEFHRRVSRLLVLKLRAQVSGLSSFSHTDCTSPS